jgi:sphingosine kinase
LVPLDQKTLPDSWVTNDNNFLSIMPCTIPYMSSDFFCDRELVMGSGFIRIMWVDGNITRKRVFNMMTSAESGRHTEMGEVYKIDVKAFRLEPEPTTGIMTIDGEVVPYGIMQAQVHPQMARIMSRRRKS